MAVIFISTIKFIATIFLFCLILINAFESWDFMEICLLFTRILRKDDTEISTSFMPIMSGFYYSLDSRHILCHNSSCWRGFNRTKSHMITLQTCGFYRPQINKPHDHITHIRIQQTTEAQAIDHIAHMRIQHITEQQTT